MVWKESLLLYAPIISVSNSFHALMNAEHYGLLKKGSSLRGGMWHLNSTSFTIL